MAFPTEDLAKLILRVGLGVHMVALHGWGKVVAYSTLLATFPDPLGIGRKYSLMGAIAGEVVCAALVVLGLGTRFAAAGVAFTMGVAAFLQHAPDPWKRRELALVFLAGFLAIALLGGGRYALDALLFRRRSAGPRPPR